MTTLVPAQISDKAEFRVLLDHYITEFELHSGPQPDYPYFDAYWQEPDSRWPYLIRDQGHTAGFVMVNTWSAPSTSPASGPGTNFSIAEFYIIPAARRRKIGKQAALAAFHTHPGTWQVSVVKSNHHALRFWTRILKAEELTNMKRTSDAGHTLFRFHI